MGEDRERGRQLIEPWTAISKVAAEADWPSRSANRGMPCSDADTGRGRRRAVKIASSSLIAVIVVSSSVPSIGIPWIINAKVQQIGNRYPDWEAPEPLPLSLIQSPFACRPKRDNSDNCMCVQVERWQ